MTPKAQFAGKYEDFSLAWELPELEIDIVENVHTNRQKPEGQPYATALDVGVNVFNVLCPLSGENEGQISPMSLEEGEDGNLLVVKCLMKCLIHSVPKEPWPEPKQEMTFTDGTVLSAQDYAFSSPESLDTFVHTLVPERDRTEIAEVGCQCRIGDYTFAICTALKTVRIGSGVTRIGEDAFSRCPALEAVYFNGKTKAEVEAMENYPWGIEDTSVIKAEL